MGKETKKKGRVITREENWLRNTARENNKLPRRVTKEKNKARNNQR